MNDTAPPPPARSLRAHVQRAASISRFVAALLATAVSVRFAVAGAEHALGVSSGNFSQKPAGHAPVEPSAPLVSPPPRIARAPVAPPSASALPAGRPLRVTLGVNYGDPRSEVYVNGSLVGQTPFLGDTSCKSGQPIRIEVVPKASAPLTYLRTCRGGSLELNGPPP